MKRENYEKLMAYLDVIEAEMDKISKAVGHPTREEFFAMKEAAEQEEIKRAA